jgi:hypothetical protein
MKRFIIITLGLIILYLLFFGFGKKGQTNPMIAIIKSVSDLFGQSFSAVTNVGNWNQSASPGAKVNP